jgi:hypothetical protein
MNKKKVSRYKRRWKKDYYFSTKEEEAVVEYLQLDEDQYIERNRIYVDRIHPALDRMVSALINKHWNLEVNHLDINDLHFELLEHLRSDVLPKIKVERGKAFSYFTRSAYNFLKGRQNLFIRNELRQVPIDDLDERRNLHVEENEKERLDDLNNFIHHWIPYYQTHLEDIFNRPSQQRVAEAILTLFERVDDIDIFYKKALYLLIKEMSDSKQITPVVKVVKKHFYEMYNDYLEYNRIFHISDYVDNYKWN